MSNSYQYRDLPGIEYPPRSETPLDIHNRNELFTKYRSNTPSMSSEDSFDPLHVSNQTQLVEYPVDEFDHESVATAGSSGLSDSVQSTNEPVYPIRPDGALPYNSRLQPQQLQGQTSVPTQPEAHENIARSERFNSTHVKKNKAPHACAICGKSFTRKVILDNHVKFHEGIREHECKECGKAFSRKNDLRRHQMIHKGIRKHMSPTAVLQPSGSSSVISNSNPVPSVENSNDTSGLALLAEIAEYSRSFSLPGPDDWQSEHSAQPQKPLVDCGIVAFSDSGYASVRNERGKHVSQADQGNHTTQQRVLEKEDYPEVSVHEAEDDYEDTKTIYSDASSATGSMKETYIAELVEDLSRCMPVVPNVVDDAVMERLYSTLPYLLKSFARKIGSLDHCRESRAVMVFVSKYRQ